MPDSLPEFAPLPTWEPRLVHHSDGPSAVSVTPLRTDAPAPSPASAEAAPLTVPPGVSDTRADTTADGRTVSADGPADGETVSASRAVSVTDASLTPVTDTDATDADTGIRLPELVPFGEEINPATLFILAAARAAMSITAAGVKGAAKSGTWNTPPESPGGHHAWVKDKTWIPKGYEDEGMFKFLVFLRKAWGWLIGMPFTVVGNALVHLRRPQVFLAAAIGALLFYMFVIR